MRLFVILSIAASLTACGASPSTSTSEAANIKDQIGRYQLIEAKGTYPAMIFDTATACLEPVYVIVGGDKDGSLQRAGMIGQDSAACRDLPIAKFRAGEGK